MLVELSAMLMVLRYLTCYMTAMVGLIMIFLTTAIHVVQSPIGLTLAILLITVMSLMSLIRVTHPPAPPYRVALLFRQVRIRLGLTPNLNYVDEVDCKNNMVDNCTLLLIDTLR